MKGPSMRLDLVTWTVVWVDACCLARICSCSERTEMAWPQVEQRVCFRSSAASRGQPSQTPGRLQRRPQPSLPLICQGGAVESPLCFASKVAPKAVVAAFFWNRPSWMLEQRPCSEDDSWTHFDFKPPPCCGKRLQGDVHRFSHGSRGP